MLTIRDAKQRYCDGVNRRGFLALSGLGLAGLSLPELLRSRARAGTGSSTKAVIIVVLPGGTPHLDMWDLKPDAPREIRGDFRPIETRVPGMLISEKMPRLAEIADKLAILRNMAVEGDAHLLHRALTGFLSFEKRPPFGSVVSRLRGNQPSALPHYVSMIGDIHPENIGHDDPRYLGAAHRPFVPNGPDLQNLRLPREITPDRLRDRKDLLKAFDGLRRQVDAGVKFGGVDRFAEQALEIASSNRARDAFDLDREPESIRRLYGMDIRLKKQAMYTHKWRGSKFLMARRLVEAGVPVVSLSSGFWDTHTDNTIWMSEQLPLLDRSLHALLRDLDQRGMTDDVAVVVWGEFYGRSPRINALGGRDHWKQSGSVLVAGGGLSTGQVIGATDARGYSPVGRTYGPQNVLATMYHVLGINPSQTLPDHNGRPQFLLEDRERIEPLL